MNNERGPLEALTAQSQLRDGTDHMIMNAEHPGDLRPLRNAHID